MIQDNGAPISDRGLLKKTIRKKIVELLRGNTDAGSRVLPNASIFPSDGELPVILVYPRSESVSEYARAPRELERTLDVAIEVIAKGPEDNPDLATPAQGEKSLEDILDDIAEQIEEIMHKDDSLGGVADESIYTNAEYEFDKAGSMPIGSVRLTYSVKYYTMAPRENEELDAFETTKADWNLDNDDNADDASDEIELDQE